MACEHGYGTEWVDVYYQLFCRILMQILLLGLLVKTILKFFPTRLVKYMLLYFS